jgi:nucleoside-diphosphate-sugar epimerase
MKLLVTGSAGLVGTPLVLALREQGHEVVEIDVRFGMASALDFRDERGGDILASGIEGVIHLAAVSRVAWGEADPALCHAINVEGTEQLLRRQQEIAPEAWFLFASSREVYGDPASDQVRECDPLRPVNHYGRSKLKGEGAVQKAREVGLATATVRLCNVYGGREDHPDRAVPALLWRALQGEPLVLTGGGCYFDFVHVEDVVSGILRVVDLLAAGERALPTVHLATGRKTTLRGLAQMAVEAADSSSPISEVEARSFDVTGFCGAPDFAAEVIGWRARTTIEQGLAALVADMRAHGALPRFAFDDFDRIIAEASKKALISRVRPTWPGVSASSAS